MGGATSSGAPNPISPSSKSQQNTSGTCRPGGNCRRCKKYLHKLLNSSSASSTTPDVLRRFLTVGRPRDENGNASGSSTPTSNNQKDLSPHSSNNAATAAAAAGTTPRASPRDRALSITPQRPSSSSGQRRASNATTGGGPVVIHGSFPSSPRPVTGTSSISSLACLNNLNYTQSDGGTPLEAAISGRSLSLATISVLLEFGAQATVRVIRHMDESYLSYASLMTSMVAYGQLTMDRAINEWGYGWLGHITNLDWLTLLRLGLDPYYYSPLKPASQPPLWQVSSTNNNRALVVVIWQKEVIDTICDSIACHLNSSDIDRMNDIIDTIIGRYYVCPLTNNDITR